MKGYLFYWIDNDAILDEDRPKRINLYAWTDDKKIAKEFIKTRDMSKFKLIKRMIDSDFANDIFYVNQKLDMGWLSDGINDIEIPMNREEYMQMCALCDSIEDKADENLYAIEKTCFNKEIMDLLRDVNSITEFTDDGNYVSKVNSYYAFMKIFGNFMSINKKTNT